MLVRAVDRPFLGSIRSVQRAFLLPFFLIIVLYGVLLLPVLGRQGISWDEQTDIVVARSYVSQPGGWFIGSNIDPSQTRLPMFTVAVVYALTGARDLLTARFVSVVVGALTLIGVYVFCALEYDDKRGLLAAGILACSPFYLSFAKTAFTETDVYVACALIWLLVAVSNLHKKRTVGATAIAAFPLGLAVSAKFTAIFAFPAAFLYMLAWPQQASAGERVRPRDLFGICVPAAILFALAWFGWSEFNYAIAQESDATVAATHYVLAAVLWASVLMWMARRRDYAASPHLLAVLLVLVALTVCVMIPPAHLTNPDIFASLRARFDREMGWNPGFMLEAVGLHLSSVIFKSSPVVGLGILAGFAATLFQWRRRPEVRLPLLLVIFYFLGLALLPIAQTFYMMPLLPILAIFAADQWLNLLSRRKRFAVLAAIAAAGMLVLDLWLCFPDYNLNGYQWLGARYLMGRSTIGYRSVVQTTSDGIQQAVEWVCDNASKGERVAVYVLPWHIVWASCPNPPFRFVRGAWGTVRSNPEFLLTHINHQIRQSWAGQSPGEDVFWQPYDTAWIEANYDEVFTVQRAFGLKMASVWQRKDRIAY
jgi:4-amino-4-deoxy-L-arabinose transferase-like glycosyltransferase